MELTSDNAFALADLFNDIYETKNEHSLIGELLYDGDGKFRYDWKVNHIIVSPKDRLQDVVRNFFTYDKDNDMALKTAIGSYTQKMSVFLVSRHSRTNACELEEYINKTGIQKEYFESIKNSFLDNE